MSLADLEKRGALQILAHLYREEKATITQLRKTIKAAVNTIYSALWVLERIGLVMHKEDEGFPRTIYYMLTEKGRRVAELLAQIEAILERRE